LKAIDTNIVLRLITGDDEPQTMRALAFLKAQPVVVTLSVAMEVEWVLRSAYQWSRAEIADALTAFSALEHVEFEQRTGMDWAVTRLRNGAAFADMIHAISASDTDAFVTFDRKLAPSAGPDAPVQIETLP
jgi:predicted nucleic-acid-binding protein